MNKAILVMHMPERCKDCWMYFEDYKRADRDGTPRKICPAINGWGHIDDEKTRPDWCPLQMMPNHKHERLTRYEDGWNDCLDAILGGNENG